MTKSATHTVQIRLTIHREGEDVRVDFPFDTETDDIDQVVDELAQNCELNTGEMEELKALIQTQIERKTHSSLSRKRLLDDLKESMPFFDIHNSDEEFVDDPEYAALLEQQRRELVELQERHLKEQRELKMGRSIAPLTPHSQGCDDLLIF